MGVPVFPGLVSPETKTDHASTISRTREMVLGSNDIIAVSYSPVKLKRVSEKVKTRGGLEAKRYQAAFGNRDEEDDDKDVDISDISISELDVNVDVNVDDEEEEEEEEEEEDVCCTLSSNVGLPVTGPRLSPKTTSLSSVRQERPWPNLIRPGRVKNPTTLKKTIIWLSFLSVISIIFNEE